MKFKDKKYNDLIVDQHNRVKEVTVIVTPYCKGGCKHCLYHRDRIGDREWDKLWEQVYQYFGSLDLEKDKVIIAIEGGELFSEELVQDKEYVRQLGRLVKFLYSLLEKSSAWYLAFSVSPENIRETGIEILKGFEVKYPNLRVNIAFSNDRFANEKKVNRFWSNLKYLKDNEVSNQLGIGVLMTDGFVERKYIKRLSEYASSRVVDFAEPHLFDSSVFCYDGINATDVYDEIFCGSDIELNPCLRRGIPSLHHTDIYVTSRGVLNGFHLLHRPEWIDEKEWNRIRDDEEYRVFGYQQVLDWYGCNNCEYLYKCQGMLWTSYYAQKDIYHHRKCLYK